LFKLVFRNTGIPNVKINILFRYNQNIEKVLNFTIGEFPFLISKNSKISASYGVTQKKRELIYNFKVM